MVRTGLLARRGFLWSGAGTTGPIVLFRSMVSVDQFFQVMLEFLFIHGTKPAFFRGMIRKLKSGEYRLYSAKADAKTGKRKNLGTFGTRAAAEKHEREVQYFKRAHG